MSKVEEVAVGYRTIFRLVVGEGPTAEERVGTALELQAWLRGLDKSIKVELYLVGEASVS